MMYLSSTPPSPPSPLSCDTHLVMVPSQKDVHHPWAIYPQPPFRIRMKVNYWPSSQRIWLPSHASISVHPHPSHASIFTHPPHTSISRIHLMHPSHTSTSYIHHLIHPSHTSIFHASISRIHLVHPSHTFISCIHLVHPSHASISHIHLKEDIWKLGTSEHLPQVRFLHWIEDTLLNLPLVISSNS